MKRLRLSMLFVGLGLQFACSISDAENGVAVLRCDASSCSWQGAGEEADCNQWTSASQVTLDPKDGSVLLVQPGEGVLVSTLQGRADHRNLISKQTYGDMELQLDFLLAKGSNGGVKLQGLYEIQIRDTHGIANPAADDCGGVYPRAQLRPYKLIDEGIPPLTNAARPAGEWQSLCILFQAPRFDKTGKKKANAKLMKVVLNEKTIHENVELRWPTGHYWNIEEEVAKGPLFLQGDHGPIAYRNVRVKPLYIENE